MVLIFFPSTSKILFVKKSMNSLLVKVRNNQVREKNERDREGRPARENLGTMKHCFAATVSRHLTVDIELLCILKYSRVKWTLGPVT